MAPLDGLTIIDLTRALSGPYCTMLLADMGARVIKVELPGRGDETRSWGPPFINGESAYFLSINRNKESITLDFKRPEGRAVLDALLARADVLVENFRPGTLDRQQLGYKELSAQFPRLIYCSISGFGQTGPRRELAGYDAVIQAEAGLMSVTGPPGGSRYRLGVAIADIAAGMFAAQGILLSLITRQKTGRGQLVDIGMLDSVVALLSYQAGSYFATGKAPVSLGNRHPTIVPYETFEASDGEFVLAVGNDDQWQRFCVAVALPELSADQRFASNPVRVRHYAELRPILADRLKRQTRREWIDRLSRAGVPCGSVRDIGEVMTDPQIEARQMAVPVEHETAGTLQVLGVPIKLSETPGGVRAAPPTLGQHTIHLLTHDLGMTSKEIERLKESGVI